MVATVLFSILMLAAQTATPSQPPVVPDQPPVVLETPHIEGTCVGAHYISPIVRISFVVNAHGKGEQFQVTKSSGVRCWDVVALKTVVRYKFSPASKAGVPIPVKMQVEVDLQ